MSERIEDDRIRKEVMEGEEKEMNEHQHGKMYIRCCVHHVKLKVGKKVKMREDKNRN